jgi:hypothetical protein
MTHRAKARKIANCKNMQAADVFPARTAGPGTEIAFLSLCGRREKTCEDNLDHLFFLPTSEELTQNLASQQQAFLRALPAVLLFPVTLRRLTN